MALSKISILRDIQHKKAGGFILDEKKGETVAIVKKNKKMRFINQNQKSTIDEMEIDTNEYIIEPCIPLSLERFIIMLSAEGGSGKTLVTSILIAQYNFFFPKRPVYYICNTSYKDDVNLKHLKIIQLDTEDIDEKRIEDFTDSLVVIDDTDFHKDHKKIMQFMNTIVELGRKYRCNLIYSSHIHSKLSQSPIYKEVSLYITFPNALINNLMIKQNLKIPEHIVLTLIEKKPAFICFSKIYRCVVTDKEIFKY